MRPLLVLLVFSLDVWAILEVLGSRARWPAKLGWIGLVVFLPLVGAGAWLVSGRGRTAASVPSREP